jgi:hypothetical protein
MVDLSRNFNSNLSRLLTPTGDGATMAKPCHAVSSRAPRKTACSREGRLVLRGAMKPRLNDYLIPIGRLAIAGAFLEEVVIRWGALLSGAVHHETHAKHLRRGLKSNLDFLVKQVELRVSPQDKGR